MKPALSILALVLTASASAVLADTVTVFGVDNRTPGAKLDNVTVLAVRGDNLVFRTPGGEERERPLKNIFKININADLALTSAEDAYSSKQYDKAIEGYQKVVRGGDGWKVSWAVPRLLDAAEKTKRFDAALAGYVGLARTDPAAAAAIRPALPPKGSKFLDDAARELETAARSATKDPERQALLSFLLDVQLARGDQAAAETTVDQLLKLAGPNTDDPKLAGMVANIRLGQARVAFEAKRWKDVAAAIDAAAPRLLEPRLQAEALYLRAEAKLGQAKADDRGAQLDAAIGFVRVAAHFRESEERPFVAQSLLRAADALQSAGNAAEARSLCEQVAVEFPDTPFAAQAAQRIAKITKPS